MIDQVFVWETANGEQVAALPNGLPVGGSAVAFSNDGRFLATALPEGAIRIREVASWSVQNEFKGHRDQPTTLTFAPGGQLHSGNPDTTVLAWDIRPPRVADSVSLESAWNDLATKGAGESFKSEGKFLAAPADTVKLLVEKVKPVEDKSVDVTDAQRSGREADHFYADSTTSPFFRLLLFRQIAARLFQL